MSKYEVRYVGDWISYIYDNEIKEAIKVSNEDFVRLLNKQEEQISNLETKLAKEKENLTRCDSDRKFEQQKKDIAMKRVLDLKEQLLLTEKALELACEELYDSDSISICAYCPYAIQDECADECPQNTKVLEKYFKTKAKEMKSE